MSKRSKKQKNYFTQETEEAIILYNNTEDPIKRSRIYEKHIHYPFFKLTQNIIHTFKFYHTDVEELEDLQHEIIVFLLSKIHLYNHINNLQKRLDKIIVKEFRCSYSENFEEYVGGVDRVSQEQINGFIELINITPLDDIDEKSKSIRIKECKERLKTLTPPKAFSYFGTIVKRWLIIYNEKNYNNKLTNSQIEDLHHDPNHSYNLGDGKSYIEDLSLFIDEFTEYVTENIYTLFSGDENAKIADAILELFRKRGSIEDIDSINKKTSYLYIREIYPEVKTPKITKIANTLKGIFNKHFTFYLENGYTNFGETTTKSYL